MAEDLIGTHSSSSHLLISVSVGELRNYSATSDFIGAGGSVLRRTSASLNQLYYLIYAVVNLSKNHIHKLTYSTHEIQKSIKSLRSLRYLILKNITDNKLIISMGLGFCDVYLCDATTYLYNIILDVGKTTCLLPFIVVSLRERLKVQPRAWQYARWRLRIDNMT